jgi:glycosyltransferase involved in cell wall biosynthesis
MLILSAIDAPAAALLIVLATLSAATAAVWGVVLGHALRTIARLPTAAAGLAAPARDESVAVVVPAHNESGTIGRLVDSLRAQDHPGARFVLALDRCTDDTEAVARRHIADDDRFEIIEIDACPDEWAGKVNAAWTGVQRSRAAADADLLVFTDADCAFDPGCLRACAGLLHGRGLDLLSLLSTLETRGWFEWVCQPAATLELVRQYPLLRANRTDRTQRPFANGQFMMFRADAYHAVGGHEAVRDALLEDIAFARLLALPRHGYRTGLLLAGGMVRCRMYENWSQFRTGWKRIYTESLNRRSRRMRSASWRTRAVGTLLPLASAGCLAAALAVETGEDPLGVIALASALAGLGLWVLGLAVVLASGRAPLPSLPLQIAGSWLVGGILAEGARDLASGTPTRWGGRAYVLEDRS